MNRLLISAFVFLLILTAGGAGAQRSDTSLPKAEDPRLITVTGEAQVNVVPDEVIVSIGVQATGSTPDDAKNKQDAIVKRVLGVADGLKIDKRNIQTDHIEVEIVKPEYYGWVEDKGPRLYGARQMIRFTLKDVSKVEPLMSKALTAGATRIIGVDYKTTELRKYRDQARSMAIKAAKEKAVAMAAGLDQHIGKPWKITEEPTYGNDWYYYGSWWWWGGRGSSMANSVQNVASAPGTPTAEGVSLGQISVTAKVTVSFELL